MDAAQRIRERLAQLQANVARPGVEEARVLRAMAPGGSFDDKVKAAGAMGSAPPQAGGQMSIPPERPTMTQMGEPKPSTRAAAAHGASAPVGPPVGTPERAAWNRANREAAAAAGAQFPVGSPERTQAMRDSRAKSAQQTPEAKATEVAAKVVAGGAGDLRDEHVQMLIEDGLTPEMARTVADADARRNGPMTRERLDEKKSPPVRGPRAERLGGMARSNAALDAQVADIGAQRKPPAPTAAARSSGVTDALGNPVETAGRGQKIDPITGRPTPMSDRERESQARTDMRKWADEEPGSERQRQFNPAGFAEWQRQEDARLRDVRSGWAEDDRRKYGDGQAPGTLTTEQRQARTDRAKSDRARVDPQYAQDLRIERHARDYGLTLQAAEKELYPAGRPPVAQRRGPSPAELARQERKNNWVANQMEKAGTRGPVLDRTLATGTVQQQLAALTALSRMHPHLANHYAMIARGITDGEAARHANEVDARRFADRMPKDKPEPAGPQQRAAAFFQQHGSADMSMDEMRLGLQAELMHGDGGLRDADTAGQMADQYIRGWAHRSAARGTPTLAAQRHILSEINRVSPDGKPGAPMTDAEFVEHSKKYGLSQDEALNVYYRLTGKPRPGEVADGAAAPAAGA